MTEGELKGLIKLQKLPKNVSPILWSETELPFNTVSEMQIKCYWETLLSLKEVIYYL